MPGLRDKLHDRVDKREELADTARDIAKQIVRDNIAEALHETETFENALIVLAAKVAEALDDHTTEAARAGAAMARGRSARG